MLKKNICFVFSVFYFMSISSVVAEQVNCPNPNTFKDDWVRVHDFFQWKSSISVGGTAVELKGASHMVLNDLGERNPVAYTEYKGLFGLLCVYEAPSKNVDDMLILKPKLEEKFPNCKADGTTSYFDCN